MMFPTLPFKLAGTKLLVTDNSEQHVEEPPGVQEFIDTLESIPGCSDCDETNVKVWIEMDSKDQGYHIQDDDEIVKTVTEQNVEEDTSDTEFSGDNVSCHSHAKVQDMLTQCLPWVKRQPETTPTHLFMYRNLLELASEKRRSSLCQSKITSYSVPSQK